MLSYDTVPWATLAAGESLTVTTYHGHTWKMAHAKKEVFEVTIDMRSGEAQDFSSKDGDPAAG